MDGNWIVNACADSRIGQKALEFSSFRCAHHIQVIDGAGPRWLERQRELGRNLAQQLLVSCRNFPPLLIPFREVPQFYTENTRLDRIEPPIVTFHLMVILARLPVISQHPRHLW